jgi:hypothetical protein
MASDTVQGVRMHGIAADDAISHAMDRFRLRHRRHGSGEPQEALRPEGASEDVSGPLGVRVP